MRFASKRALVTGATGAIGGAIATALLKEGATVDVVSRQPPIDERFNWHQLDLFDAPDNEAAVSSIADKIDRLYVLVHSAGHYSSGAIQDTPITELDRLWGVNARAPWILTQALLPALIEAKGTVVFVNSSIWLRSAAGVGGYAASKYAMKAIADALREEVSRQGVHVQSVYPGRTAGAIQERIAADESRPYDPAAFIQPMVIAEAVLENILSKGSNDLHVPAAKTQ